jgi:predicted DNA-binding transcriptional regulator YafY
LIATGLHRTDPIALLPTLEDLRRATRGQRQISAIYQSATKTEATKRKINPSALVFRAGLWYLVGYCHLRSAPRTFRVDRIQELTVLSQPFQMLKDFDIHKYLENELKDQSTIRARLKFIPGAAHIVTSNRPIWESIQEESDGSMVVTLTAPDLPWLASMTLSFANLVTVLGPPELRNMIREWAQATIDLYQE